ncbi:hypothetical protein [Pelosinus sp. sgz500959]|uniref:hypothetical protein n=1 Tax=Pelosinus sp. sgz500959 TaxID=3242472 RepID=UPI00366DB7F8
MVELENFHLMSFRGIEFNQVLILMQLQDQYISQIYQHIDALSADFLVSNKVEFKEFMIHLKLFIQYHARSEGFCIAMETIQVYNRSLLDKLLNNNVLVAAEELERSIIYLEDLISQLLIRTAPQIILLNQNISNLEETQLKIIEFLEGLLLIFRQTYLEN